MYDAATTNCSFGLAQVSDLTTRRSSAGHHPSCGGQPPSSVQVKIEECLSNTEEWAAGCAYRFAARRCYMSSEDNSVKAATAPPDANRVLDPGGFNSALAATFRNRYLGASAFSNPPALFPGSYVGGTDISKQGEVVPNVLNGNSTANTNNTSQGQHPGVDVPPRSSSPPPINSSSSSTSSTRSNHQVDTTSSKGKGADRRVVVPAGELLLIYFCVKV
ncbi:uncharacterized protein TNCT_136341 [Trichonephila clavata]|uniref:Uncharacterized protein n=1 Tax=Trichonephila clavata TaxID=2740835 RepID=A0A8X6GKV0_TRICU|nr:uncharacterized protein TNCT_136341 [Trichonephila clavata]